MSDFDESYRLIYAEEPGHIRLAGDPWAGIAKVVEQATAVLEDGQRKLAEVWRSPGGTAYLAEMGRVVEAMRATSDAARHNDQVMSAAADALDGKQKDFAVLSTAPVPSDARARYARAIVNSLDEDYQQAVANFHPVPEIDPRREEDRPLVAGGRDSSPSSSGGTDSTASSASGGTTPKRLPPWVPDQPDKQTSQASSHGGAGGTGSAAGTGGGPSLQGIGGTSSAPPQSGGSWSGVDVPGTGTTSPGQNGVPGGGAGTGQPSAWATTGPSTGVARPAPVWRDTTGRSARSLTEPSRGRAGLAMPEPEGSRPNTATSGRSAAAGQPGSAVGGVPVGGSGGSTGRSWSGYRRRPEPFPTSPLSAVPPLIAPAVTEEEPGLDEVTTDYIDDCGNQITIRRPRD